MPTPRRASRRRTYSRPSCDALRERLSSFTADDACDVAFALSRARCVSDELLDDVSVHANTTATSAEALARLCYAFARKGVRRGEGASTAASNARQAVNNGGTLSLDALSRCCWASAALEGEDASVLFNECTKRVARCANDFTGKQLVTIAFAASKKRSVDSVIRCDSRRHRGQDGRTEPAGAVERGLRLRHRSEKGPHPLCGRGSSSTTTVKELRTSPQRLISVVLLEGWFQGAAALRRFGFELCISLTRVRREAD